MTTDEDRHGLAEQFAALPVRELVTVLRQVLPRYTEGGHGLRTTLLLATAMTDEVSVRARSAEKVHARTGIEWLSPRDETTRSRIERDLAVDATARA
ncbi:hypothetical protein ACIBO1_19250 [Micromonospora sp. NPDC049903]|uniref:hypothetical protein n=1 Tax=Micromonospora sp. NPDC049903 TaxID=3364276 RepID=UPI0037A68D2D